MVPNPRDKRILNIDFYIIIMIYYTFLRKEEIINGNS